MNRNAEAALVVGAAAIAAFGVALVNLALGQGIDAQVGLTFLVFLIAFGIVHLAVRRWAPRATPYIWPLAAVLTAIGFAEVYRLDPRLAALQRWWLLIAAALVVILMFALHKVGVAVLRRYRYVFLALALLLLALPFLPSSGPLPLHGLEVNGSRLWIRLDLLGLQFNFQPTEIAKLLMVAFLASFLAERRNALIASGSRSWIRLPQPRQLVPLVVAWALSVAVLVYQRDLGASLLLLAIVVTMLYAATASPGYIWTGAGLFVAGGVGAWIMFDHVQRRVTAWLVPFSDYEDSGFQMAQSLFALGTGSISGSGLGLGRPDLIPHAETDFVLAAVGEELGLAGVVAVISLFTLLVGVSFGIALRARDSFRKLLAAGLALLIGLQALLIIGGILRAFPLTGLPLPFMSYGGSALVGSFAALALLSRVSHEEPS